MPYEPYNDYLRIRFSLDLYLTTELFDTIISVATLMSMCAPDHLKRHKN